MDSATAKPNVIKILLHNPHLNNFTQILSSELFQFSFSYVWFWQRKLQKNISNRNVWAKSGKCQKRILFCKLRKYVSGANLFDRLLLIYFYVLLIDINIFFYYLTALSGQFYKLLVFCLTNDNGLHLLKQLCNWINARADGREATIR